MPTSELQIISARPASSSNEVSRRWCVALAELFGKTLTPQFVDLWSAVLEDLPGDVLDRACKQASRTCKFFPAPAEIREHIDHANANGLELEADSAWDQVLDWVREWYGNRRAPALPERIEYAARVAGRLGRIEGCPTSELQWVRKQFIEGFKRFDELERSEMMLTRDEAKRLLGNLRQASGPRALPTPAGRRKDPVHAGSLTVAHDVFAEVASHLPEPEPEPEPVKRPVFQFPADADHAARVRRQAAEMRAKAGS